MFEHSTLHGLGKLDFPNGTIIRGNFNYGVPAGVAGLQSVATLGEMEQKWDKD
jgi:hypothetical protein